MSDDTIECPYCHTPRPRIAEPYHCYQEAQARTKSPSTGIVREWAAADRAKWIALGDKASTNATAAEQEVKRLCSFRAAVKAATGLAADFDASDEEIVALVADGRFAQERQECGHPKACLAPAPPSESIAERAIHDASQCGAVEGWLLKIAKEVGVEPRGGTVSMAKTWEAVCALRRAAPPTPARGEVELLDRLKRSAELLKLRDHVTYVADTVQYAIWYLEDRPEEGK